MSLKIFGSNAIKAVMTKLAPLFERESGTTLAIEYGTSNGLMDRIAAGETADLALLTGAGIEDQIGKGKLAQGSRLDFAQTGVGVGIRAGSPKPDVSTKEAFIRSLLATPSITFTSTGASGQYFAGLIERLGIAEQIRAKAIIPPAGLVGEIVMRGEAEIGIQLFSELLAVPGIEIAGPFPAEVQNTMVFSAGIFAASPQAEASRALYRFLQSPAARQVMEASGMQPL